MSPMVYRAWFNLTVSVCRVDFKLPSADFESASKHPVKPSTKAEQRELVPCRGR